MPGYEPSKEKLYIKALKSGIKTINVSATCIMMNFIDRILKQVIEDLNTMVAAGKNLSYSLVRQFVVNFYNLEMADLLIWTAMRAPKDDIWYQSRS